jgi:Zn-dependent peptidase ImmA (M78 family)
MTRKQLPPHVQALDMLNRHMILGPPVPVEELAKLEGAEIVRVKAKGGESGFTLRANEAVIIGVNSGTSRRRQRFTIAHELGHLAMHEGRPLIVDHSIRVNYRTDVRSMATNEEEIQANAFAAALLMPDEWVRGVAEKILSRPQSREELITSLVREFDVSPEAMGFRLINLGVLSA